MKARAVLTTASFALLVAVACAPGAGAEVPPGTPDSGDGGQAAQTFPTSTPWPRFGPPPVTADSITPTAQVPLSAPGDSSETEATPTVTTVSAGTEDDDVELPVTSRSPSPGGTPTPLDNSGTFEPVLPVSYVLPLDWEDVIGDDEIVLVHRSDQTRITVRERHVDREFMESVIDLVRIDVPTEFVDWSERSLFDARVVGSNSVRLEYAGTKFNESYIAIVDWYLWGELLVEVVTEAEATAWALDTNLHNTALLLATSFTPDPVVQLANAAEIENQLRVRFNQRDSNIFVNSVGNAVRTQLSCREVLFDLLSGPVYVSSGEWQVFAVTEQGAQVWRVFEPTLNIVPADHNTSSC